MTFDEQTLSDNYSILVRSERRLASPTERARRLFTAMPLTLRSSMPMTSNGVASAEEVVEGRAGVLDRLLGRAFGDLQRPRELDRLDGAVLGAQCGFVGLETGFVLRFPLGQ